MCAGESSLESVSACSMPASTETLGDALRKKRGERQQDTIALEFDVQQSTYGRWEKDQSEPGAEFYDRIEKFLGVDDAKLGLLIVRGARRRLARHAMV